MHFTSLFGSGLLFAAYAQANPIRNVERVLWPFKLFNGTTDVESISEAGQLDSPKLMPHTNASTFDW